MLLHAELMYRPRPTDERARAVFDYAFRARLATLSDRDTLLLICDSDATRASLQPPLADFPRLTIQSVIVNPQPCAPQADTPNRCEWEAPQSWQQMDMSDRWVRILAALRAAIATQPDLLVMPAHDAVYTRAIMEAAMERTGDRPFSLTTRHTHSLVAAANILTDVIDLHNAAFDRKPLARIGENGGQGFWGKLGAIPGGLCAAVLNAVDTHAWEDDLEIDRVLTEIGSPALCIPIEDAAGYRLCPPIFDHESVRRVIERHLHYSLKIPGERRSALHAAPSEESWQRAQRDPRYARLLTEADAMISDCEAAMRAHVARFGMSWVDWGGYRYAAAPRNPQVEVWKQS
ncbi:MAG: hypothetical protein SF123_08350 [Chloroflexota bacterium]|nr:hypothetical protein [Chloroflexota bacterium]